MLYVFNITSSVAMISDIIPSACHIAIVNNPDIIPSAYHIAIVNCK